MDILVLHQTREEATDICIASATGVNKPLWGKPSNRLLRDLTI